MRPTDEQIAAFADGELEGEEREAIAAAVGSDPGLAAAVERHRALRARLGAHFAPLVETPVPDRLFALIGAQGTGSEVVSLAKVRESRGLSPVVRRWAPFAIPALAASLALAIVLPRSDDGAAAEGQFAGTRLAEVLDRRLSGETSGPAEGRILLSFQKEDGAYCRVYQEVSQAGIACRETGGWRVVRSLSGSQAQSTEYRQAGSSLADLLATAQDMSVGGALDTSDEERVRTKGWR